MKILALDTATKSCSVALTENGLLSAELTMLRDQTHSKHLMDVIDSVFEISGFGGMIVLESSTIVAPREGNFRVETL